MDDKRKFLKTKELLELRERGIDVPDYRFIFAQIREGATDEEIMKMWGGTRVYIRHIDKLSHYQIWQDYENGLKVREIAQKYGITEMVVYQIIRQTRKQQEEYSLEKTGYFRNNVSDLVKNCLTLRKKRVFVKILP